MSKITFQCNEKPETLQKLFGGEIVNGEWIAPDMTTEYYIEDQEKPFYKTEGTLSDAIKGITEADAKRMHDELGPLRPADGINYVEVVNNKLSNPLNPNTPNL